MSSLPVLPKLPPGELERRAALLPKNLECVAFRTRQGRYRAICLDLSLVAESPSSMPDAMGRLVDQIDDYLADAIEAGCPPDLVHRDVGRGERLSLHLLLAAHAVRGWLSGFLPLGEPGDRAVWLQPVPTYS